MMAMFGFGMKRRGWRKSWEAWVVVHRIWDDGLVVRTAKKSTALEAPQA
jgi:hypothetical protein